MHGPLWAASSTGLQQVRCRTGKQASGSGGHSRRTPRPTNHAPAAAGRWAAAAGRAPAAGAQRQSPESPARPASVPPAPQQAPHRPPLRAWAVCQARRRRRRQALPALQGPQWRAPPSRHRRWPAGCCCGGGEGGMGTDAAGAHCTVAQAACMDGTQVWTRSM